MANPYSVVATTLNGEPFATKIANALDTFSAQVAADIGATYGVAFTARAVATSIAAYAGTGTGTLTASANGAIGAQDGVTLVAGDLLFLPSTAVTNVQAADVGPWVVVSAGGAGKYQLTRPAWWAHGAPIVQGSKIEIGGEGTVWGGSSWKSFCAKGKLVDTDDALFYPRTTGSRDLTIAGGGTVTFTGYISTQAMIATASVSGTHVATAATTPGQGGGTVVLTGTAAEHFALMVANW